MALFYNRLFLRKLKIALMEAASFYAAQRSKRYRVQQENASEKLTTRKCVSKAKSH